MNHTHANEHIHLGKIEIAGEGLGAPDERSVQIRANELARIRGRATPEADDFDEALSELTGAIELPASTALLPPKTGAPSSQWDTLVQDLCSGAEDGGSSKSTGTEAAKWEEEDEQAVPEQLVEEGVAEAEHQQRLAASDMLEEPEQEEGEVT